jgi:hypothetical protein
LGRRGVDWVDVSSGGLSPLQKISVGPGYQVPFARAVKEGAGVNTIAVGLITEARQAEEILAGGQGAPARCTPARGCQVTSWASRVISVLKSLETGQPALALAARSSKVVWVAPGILAFRVR